MKEIVKLEAYNIEQLVNLSGVKDENLEVLEDHFQVEISLEEMKCQLLEVNNKLKKLKSHLFFVKTDCFRGFYFKKRCYLCSKTCRKR